MESGAAGPKRFRGVPALIRLVLASAVLALFVYAWFSPDLSFNGALALAAKAQFSAALYGTGIAGLAALLWAALALLFGRAFCSAFCPLGTLQELIWRAGSFIRGKSGGSLPPASARLRRSSASPSPGGRAPKPPARSAPFGRKGYRALPKIRYAIPLFTGLGLAFSFTPLMILFDPISNFGRGMAALRGIIDGNAAAFSLVLALPCALILVAAFFRGRAFCGWCPAGITLGLLSKAAPFKMRIGSGCASCGICEKKCPAGCVNAHEKRIDSERCVLCFSCAAACPNGSAGYGPLREKAPSGQSRRVFLKGAAPLLCGAAYLLGADLRFLSRLGGRTNKAPELPAGNLPILPPGAKSLAHYRSRCVGCQSCAAACPVGIIKARNAPWPVLDYTDASCQYNCVECGKVCPTKAIRPLDVEEKRRTRIALSSLFFERCVVNTKREACGACAEVCPTRAVRMVPYPESGLPYLTKPVFEERYCIGCGACLVVCPADPKAFSIAAAAEQSLTPGMRPSDTGPDAGGDGALFQPEEDFPF